MRQGKGNGKTSNFRARVRLAIPREPFFLQKLQFRRIYMGKPESRDSSSRTRCGYYTFRWRWYRTLPIYRNVLEEQKFACKFQSKDPN